MRSSRWSFRSRRRILNASIPKSEFTCKIAKRCIKNKLWLVTVQKKVFFYIVSKEFRPFNLHFSGNWLFKMVWQQLLFFLILIKVPCVYFSNNIYFKRVDSLQLNQITNCTLKKNHGFHVQQIIGVCNGRATGQNKSILSPLVHPVSSCVRGTSLIKFTLQSEIDCRDQKETMWSNEEIFKTERHYLCKISV